MPIKLSVVDQSPVQGIPADISPVTLTAEMAQTCEALGYERYWLAEHHNSVNFAGPSPELLIAHIATLTQRIRVGSGGVMLSHYSPYKVAEQFRLLATLFPNRIDLGIGRAPGGDGLASHALAYPGSADHHRYNEQAVLLQGMLDKSLPENLPYSQLRMMPDDSPRPESWMLSSSGDTAPLAARLGMNLSLALFITPDWAPADIFRLYRNAWREAGHEGDPKAMVGIASICADSQEEAEFLAASQILWKVMAFNHGLREPVKEPQQALDLKAKLAPSDQAFYQALLDSMVCGTPDQCATRIQQIADEYQCNEVGVVTVTHDHFKRVRSYELLAQALKLTTNCA